MGGYAEFNLFDGFKKKSLDIVLGVIQSSASQALNEVLLKQDVYGRVALHYCIARLPLDVIDATKNSDLKAVLIAPDRYGSTPLHYAIFCQTEYFVQELFKDIEDYEFNKALAKQDRQGQTLVHLAILSSPDMLSTIISKADELQLFNALVKKNQYSHARLYYAAKKGSAHLMQKLRGVLKRQAINSLVQADGRAIIQSSDFIQSGSLMVFFNRLGNKFLFREYIIRNSP